MEIKLPNFLSNGWKSVEKLVAWALVVLVDTGAVSLPHGLSLTGANASLAAVIGAIHLSTSKAPK